MPRMVQDLSEASGGRSGIRVAGIQEAGGEVTEISTLGNELVARTEPGLLTGTVWDSTRSGPIPGARVFLSGTQYSTRADTSGHFLLEGLPDGVFSAAFSHPRLDTLGFHPMGLEVEIRSGEVSEVLLAIPSLGSVLASKCPEEENQEGPTSAVVGRVEVTGTNRPISGAEVIFEWNRYDLVSMGFARAARSKWGTAVREKIHIEEDRYWLEVHTDSVGHFTACGIPAGWLTIAQAHVRGLESDTVHIRVPENSFKFLNFTFASPLASADSLRQLPSGRKASPTRLGANRIHRRGSGIRPGDRAGPGRCTDLAPKCRE